LGSQTFKIYLLTVDEPLRVFYEQVQLIVCVSGHISQLGRWDSFRALRSLNGG